MAVPHFRTVMAGVLAASSAFTATGCTSSGADSIGGGSAGTAAGSGSTGVKSRTFPFEGKALTVDSEGTEVDIVPGDVDGVQVRREIHGDDVQASWGLSGDTLTLRVRLNCHGWTSDCSARHTVTVDNDVAVAVRSGAGAIVASRLTTALSITTTAGTARVEDSSGSVEVTAGAGMITGTNLTSKHVVARTTAGSLNFDFAAAPDSVDLESQTGQIDIGLPSGTGYAVDAGTGIGVADVTIPDDADSPHLVKAHAQVGVVSVHGN